jgi:hypothetical protein
MYINFENLILGLDYPVDLSYIQFFYEGDFLVWWMTTAAL